MLRHKAAITVLRSTVATILALAMGLAIGSAPALAASGDRGAVVVCNYKYLGDDSIYWGGILKQIEVNPPRLYALNASTANVGWRFIVERLRTDQLSPATWKQTYKSALQTAAASSATPAAFTTMSVKVKLPVLADPEESTWNDVYYRVTLKLFWYRADWTTQQAVTHKMKHYGNTIDGEFAWNDQGDYSCPGGHAYYQ
jgi:hypothetical protein